MSPTNEYRKPKYDLPKEESGRFVADLDDIIIEQPEERGPEAAQPKKPVKGKKEA